MRPILVLLLIMAATIGDALAADSYYISPRDGTNLYTSPDTGAEVSAHLPWKTYVKLLEKSRNWQKIQTTDDNKFTGWVFEGAIRKTYQTSSRKSGGSFLSGFTSLFRSPEPEQKTAVLGVRGLDNKGELSANASAQAKRQVEWMDTLKVSRQDIAVFIDQGALNP